MNTQLVHKVTITFKDKTKIDFLGKIVAIKWGKDGILLLRWKNAAYTEAGSATAKRLRFIDIRSIRSIEECCVGTKSDFDEEEFEIGME